MAEIYPEIEAMNDRLRGRLVLHYNPNGSETPVLTHSMDFIKRVLMGNFKELNKSTERNKLELSEKYLETINEGDVERSLAYGIMIGEDLFVPSEDDFNDFIPLDNGWFRENKFTLENNALGFRSLEYYRKNVRKISINILESEKSSGEHRKEIYNLISNFNNAREIIWELVCANTGLSNSIARSFVNNCYENNLDELVSVGNLALLKAVKKYDSSKNFRFGTYAGKTISNTIKSYLDRTLGPPIIRFDENHYEEAFDYEEENSYLDTLDEINKRNLAGLSDREIEIIKRRFGFYGRKETLKEVGNKIESLRKRKVGDNGLGISRETVRKIERGALEKYRVAFEKFINLDKQGP